jgi:hypothetical protein
MSEEKFYKIYPELLEFKNKLELLGEGPDRDNTREV